MINDNQTTSRHHSPEEKIEILRLHLQEKIPISQVCEKNQINPTEFYQWQKTLFEKGAAAFAEVTIPPATDDAFEKFAHEVCDIAEMDREDRDRRVDDVQIRLRKLWRRIEPNMGTDQAQQRAIELFGTVESVARSYNEQDARRLLLHQDGRPVRVLMVMLFWGMFFYFRWVNAQNPDKYLLALPDDFSDFVFALGCLYIVAHGKVFWTETCGLFNICLQRTRFARRTSSSSDDRNTGWETLFLFLKWPALAICVILSSRMLAVFCYPFSALRFLWGHHPWANGDFNLRVMLLTALLLLWAFLAFLVLFSAASEIFDWPRLKREGNKTVNWWFYKLPLDLKDRYLPKVVGYLGIRPKGSVE